MEQVRDGLVPYPEDDECRRQLSSVRYELRGQGKVIMELKDHVRSRLGCSPDRADAWVMGQWATQHVRPGGGVARQRHDYEDRPSYSAMTA
jgi:hypothetical protein